MDHDSLKHINSHKKLSSKHARWVDFLQEFTFFFKHKFGLENCVADALSRKTHFLSILSSTIIGFEEVKSQYASHPIFLELSH